jgi:hypothetical protein
VSPSNVGFTLADQAFKPQSQVDRGTRTVGQRVSIKGAFSDRFSPSEPPPRNPGASGTPPQSPIRKTSNRHSFPGSMSAPIGQPLFRAPKRAAVRPPKAPLPTRGRLPDGGAVFNLGANEFLNTPAWKSPEKRSASTAEMVSANDRGYAESNHWIG